MLHRHLNHSGWTLAAIDDVIARGRLDDWKRLRDAAANNTEIQKRILRVSKPHLSDPYAQRHYFWDFYVRSIVADARAHSEQRHATNETEQLSEGSV